MANGPSSADAALAACDEVARWSRVLAARGLVEGTAGNVSLRVAGSDLIAVTPTGMPLADVAAGDVALVDPGGKQTAGPLRPTSEVSLHLAIHARGGISAVVHTHAPHATAVACVVDELPCVHYELALLGGPVRVAPYSVFGSEELAAGAVAALDGRSAALLAHHGTVTTGADLPAAVAAAEILERVSALFLRASAAGRPRALDGDASREVVETVRSRSYGAPRPAGDPPR